MVLTQFIIVKGIMLEKFFTMPPSEFKQRFEKSSVASHDPQRGQPTEAYRYAKASFHYHHENVLLIEDFWLVWQVRHACSARLSRSTLARVRRV